MVEKQLVIQKVFLEKENDKKVKACSIIKSDKEDYKLWFEVDKEYEQYILTERADAFLVAILPYAIKKELDIIVEDKISSQLYYQLTTYLIPMFCEELKKRNIQIETELDSNNYNISKAVGTGMSGGIDSLYSIQKHINLKEKEFNLTHLTFFNVGASGSYGGKEARDIYESRMKAPKQFAQKYGFKFISVDSNLNEFLMMHNLYTHEFRGMACALLLQKLFSKYYYSSTGYHFNTTKLDKEIGYADILFVHCLSTEDITFYLTGMEKIRFDKVVEVSKFEPSYNYLNVCLDDDYNCSKCKKCKRTMLELYTIDKLDLYKNVFDIDYFYKHKSEYFIWLLKTRRHHDCYSEKIYEEMKKRNKNIPLSARVLSLIPDKHDLKYFALNFISEEKIKKLRHQISNDGWD